MARPQSPVLALLLLLALCCAAVTRANFAAESLDTSGLTKEELAERLLGDTDITISNVQMAGSMKQLGTFKDADKVSGLGAGIIMSTGDVQTIGNENTGASAGTDMGTPGDTDLEEVLGPDMNTFDAAVLEFDFVVDNDTVSFSYVFGSEEYDEFVGDVFNDVFAFFINGENCAKVPGSGDFVSVNTVNAGSNDEYFVSNADGARPIELDGFTTILPCVAKVVPGEVNRLKLAVTDVSDAIYDTVVLLLADSLTTNPIPVTPSPTPSSGATESATPTPTASPAPTDTPTPTPSPTTAEATPSPTMPALVRCTAREGRTCLRPAAATSGQCTVEQCKSSYVEDEAGDVCCNVMEGVTVYRSCAGQGGQGTVCCDAIDAAILRPTEETAC